MLAVIITCIVGACFAGLIMWIVWLLEKLEAAHAAHLKSVGEHSKFCEDMLNVMSGRLFEQDEYSDCSFDVGGFESCEFIVNSGKPVSVQDEDSEESGSAVSRFTPIEFGYRYPTDFAKTMSDLHKG